MHVSALAFYYGPEVAPSQHSLLLFREINFFDVLDWCGVGGELKGPCRRSLF